jgi:hypothetical protein
MTDLAKTTERDEVLFAFHEAFDRPTTADIVEWTKRYPQFADDIRAHAAVAWDWATSETSAEEPVDEVMAARAYSHALNIIYNTQPSPTEIETTKPRRTFQQMQEAIGKQTHQIARELDIGRSVLSDLFNGSMMPPIRKRLIDRLLTMLNTTLEEFLGAFDLARQSPSMSHAKSIHTPSVVPRSCDDIIRDSNMSDDRKRYWLEED